jgi:signal transduction histidine kinase
MVTPVMGAVDGRKSTGGEAVGSNRAGMSAKAGSSGGAGRSDWWVKGRDLTPVTTFLRFDQWASAASLAGVVLVNLTLLRSPGLSVVVLALAVLVALLATARRRLADGDPAAALLLLLAGNWVTVIVVSAVIPFLWPTMMITALMPAMLALPYVEGRATLILTAATIAVSLGAAAMGLFIDEAAVDLAPWLEGVVVLVTLAAVGVACGLIASSTGLVQEQEMAEIVGLNRELAVAHDRLTASRRRVVEAADFERQRIERDLHDGAQQRLVAIGVGLRLLRHQLDGRPDLAASADGLVAEAEAAVEELRELARGIYPPLLRSQGLVPALRAVARRSPSAVTVEAKGPEPEGRDGVEAALYFVAVEAMTNAAKHAPGAEVAVTVERHPESLGLQVCDDGPGMAGPSDGEVGGETPASRGLANMADRVAAVGGRLTVESPPGGGTTIRAVVPLSPAVLHRDQPAE